jgi:hypothetical protein
MAMHYILVVLVMVVVMVAVMVAVIGVSLRSLSCVPLIVVVAIMWVWRV